MGKALLAACLFVVACQPMYEKKPDALRNPIVHKAPAPAPGGGEEALAFIESCDVNFSGKPTKQRQAPASQQLTIAGNASLHNASTSAARPSTPPAINAIQDAIDKYRQALLRDPYNAEATLNLALAYDRVLRKGCALAMLRRLESLASNPTFQPEADPMVQLVVSNPHWFRPYHGDALKAVGH